MAHRKLTLTTGITLTDNNGTKTYNEIRVKYYTNYSHAKSLMSNYVICRDVSGAVEELRTGELRVYDDASLSATDYTTNIVDATDTQVEDYLLSLADIQESTGSGTKTNV